MKFSCSSEVGHSSNIHSTGLQGILEREYTGTASNRNYAITWNDDAYKLSEQVVFRLD